MNDYSKQYTMIDAIVTAMHGVIERSKVALEEVGFSPGDAFPSDENVKNSLSMLLENSALFADLALRLPDITTSIYKSKNDFRVLIDWGLVFSNSTGFYDDITTKLMHLAGQELGLIEKTADFVNPYRKNAKKVKLDENDVSASDKKTGTTKKKQEKKKRGPSMSGTSHSEL